MELINYKYIMREGEHIIKISTVVLCFLDKYNFYKQLMYQS